VEGWEEGRGQERGMKVVVGVGVFFLFNLPTKK
jgi:hypothetical protein